MLLTALRTDTTHDLSQKRPERITLLGLVSESLSSIAVMPAAVGVITEGMWQT